MINATAAQVLYRPNDPGSQLVVIPVGTYLTYKHIKFDVPHSERPKLRASCDAFVVDDRPVALMRVDDANVPEGREAFEASGWASTTVRVI